MYWAPATIMIITTWIIIGCHCFLIAAIFKSYLELKRIADRLEKHFGKGD
jgi:amino acid permease